MSQPTRSTSPFAGPDPATIPTVAAEPLLPRVVAVMAGLQALYDQVATPGVLLHEAQLSEDGLSVTLPVSGIVALSSWYEAHRGRSASVSSRQEQGPDGRWYGLGGLDWRLSLGPVADGVRVWVTCTTAESEDLPDTALVRAMCPSQVRAQQVRDREIAAHATRLGHAA